MNIQMKTTGIDREIALLLWFMSGPPHPSPVLTPVQLEAHAFRGYAQARTAHS